MKSQILLKIAQLLIAFVTGLVTEYQTQILDSNNQEPHFLQANTTSSFDLELYLKDVDKLDQNRVSGAKEGNRDS